MKCTNRIAVNIDQLTKHCYQIMSHIPVYLLIEDVVACGLLRMMMIMHRMITLVERCGNLAGINGCPRIVAADVS